ncbi:phosphate acetyltransferase [Rhodobium orientis]|uniref:Phosphate acetyltransferase n=1 Tax=Rhodobium orientis TaxID=34017 RepID=A0A327JH83_9HYPH|nr:phosphate acetyltransferase [Rhodobium orientis]MBB4301897.1 phosphate acetyltransferase [Rhodobium orientis]MBK5950135.1 phosphate acetyltransferase [Rhodobium orientis]RAI25689.1 phosphate acetyltransferase [Rhodobium orientis]
MTIRHSPLLIYVAPTTIDLGGSATALGLARALQRAGASVGFVKPIGDHRGHCEDADDSVGFARRILGLDVPDAIPLAEAEAMVRGGEIDTLLEKVVSLVLAASEGMDAVIIEGAALSDAHPLIAELDIIIARSLRASVVPVLLSRDETASGLAETIADAARRFGWEGSPPKGVVVTRIAGALAGRIGDADFAATLLGVVPEDASFTAPRLVDVVDDLGLTVLAPGDMRDACVRDVVVAARSPEHLVERLKPDTLVVTPGDRSDVIVTTAFAKASGMPIAGLLLTCGARIHPALEAFLAPRLKGLSVLSSDLETFDAVRRLGAVDRRIRSGDDARMERLIDHFADHLDVSVFLARDLLPEPKAMTPPMFRTELIRSAKAGNRRIVLPEGDEPRTLAAAAICARKGIARCVLLGAPKVVRAAAARHGIDLPESVEIVDPDAVRRSYVAPMVELRKSKGLTPQQALAQLEDSVVLGTMMLAVGDVDGLVSGAVHTTASTVRPALQLIKTRPGSTIVSSVFFMLMPDQVFVYGDCAINPNPTAEQLAEIAIESAESARAFRIEPRVAMISYSTGASGSGADVDKVREATRLVGERRPDIAIDGPIQYDAASVESVGRQKAPGSAVAGRANVFIFPDLNTGNTTYKAVQRSANVVSVGPMLQGLRKPVNDLSRGALVDDIVYTIALTAIQATSAGAAEEPASTRNAVPASAPAAPSLQGGAA